VDVLLPSAAEVNERFRQKLAEVSGASGFRLRTLDRGYTRRASSDPLQVAEHAAVRWAMQRRDRAGAAR
jgi:hypothetical protein